jgi:hypothetical protein
VAKEVHKLQQLSEGDSNPHFQQLATQHNQLVKGHNELVEAFNRNNQNFANIQQQLDIRLGAVYSVVQDLVDSLENIGAGYTSFVSTVPVTDGTRTTRRVNWPKYIQHHIDTLQVELARMQAEKGALDEGAAALAELTTSLETSPLITPEGAEEEVEEEPATVFGGDHAQAQPQDQERAAQP